MLTPTKERGAQAKAAPGLYVTRDAQVMPDDNGAAMAAAGMNGDFIADLLSAMVTHERCGTHLYRSCAARSVNPVLQGKYRSFGEETEQHVAVLEELIRQAGGNPAYVSPTARAVQGMDTKLVESTYALTGSVDAMTAETAMLDAVFLAESMDNANWVLFGRLVERLPEGPFRDQCQAAVHQIGSQEEDHLAWALQTKERLVLLQAESSIGSSITGKAEEIVARVRNWFA